MEVEPGEKEASALPPGRSLQGDARGGGQPVFMDEVLLRGLGVQRGTEIWRLILQLPVPFSVLGVEEQNLKPCFCFLRGGFCICFGKAQRMEKG